MALAGPGNCAPARSGPFSNGTYPSGAGMSSAATTRRHPSVSVANVAKPNATATDTTITFEANRTGGSVGASKRHIARSWGRSPPWRAHGP